MANRAHFRKLAAGLLAALGALMLVAGVYVLRSPRVYEALARVKVEKEWSEDKWIPRTYEGFDPFFVQTEFELIQSKVILFAVISNLNLIERWSAKVNAHTPHELYPILRDKLEIRQARNSSLIEIRAFSDDPHEAAELANAVASAYRENRREERQIRRRLGIATLQKELQQVEQKISEATQSEKPEGELATLKTLREQLARHIQGEKELPIAWPVEIIDLAEPPARHSKPNPHVGVLLFLSGLLSELMAVALFVRSTA